jgi:hypothetical protein
VFKDLSKISLLFFLFISFNLFSQTVNDSLNFSFSKYRINTFRTSFGKRLNTHNLNTLLSYSINTNNFSFGIRENYYSSFVNTQSKNIKDEQVFSIIGEYYLSPLFQFGVLVQNNIYSDDRKIAINEATTLYSTLFAKILPIDQIKIVPFGGYAINKQVGNDDRGIIYGTEISVDRYNLNEFLISSKLKFLNEEISPRKNTQQQFATQIKNKFDYSLTNLISGSYSKTRKDFYFDVDSITSREFNINKNIQSRTEENYSIGERLFSSRFGSDIFFDLSGRVSYRNIERNTKYHSVNNLSISNFDSEINELRLDFSGATEYRSKLLFARARFDYSQREEKHIAQPNDKINEIIFEKRLELEKKKNNTSEYATLSALGNFAFSKKDNLTFSILHRKLVYNTQSKNNYDDRDELLSIFRLSYLHNLNHLFSFFVNLEGSLNHIVYIFAERSSNNNIRRILKLSSGGEYKGAKLFSKNTFEVSANYTSYDFQDINPNIKSFSFRQIAARDSSSLHLYNKIYFDVSGYLKLSEQADFDWKSFSNNPDRFLAEVYSEPMINIKSNGVKLGIGFRFFLLQTFNYNKENIKYKSSEYKSVGPITNFSVRMRNLDLYFYGWYEFITNEKNAKRELANLTFSVNWRL